jgi:formylglycine-generating enzyme required for sulfatase activity
MHLFKTVVVCVAVIVIFGCDRSQPTPPVELPESADSFGMKFNLIPAGTFTMGEGDEADYALVHEVTLTKPFKMGVHEVTQAQYEQVMKNNPSNFKGAENPVENVSWEDAVEFCRKLSELPAEKAAGNVYRLPTEAEWEYACRAGTTTNFSFGDDESDFGDYAWCVENSANETHNSANETHPVGGKKPNAWGLYDMHGNVSEWCQDRYDDYPSGAVTDPIGPASSAYGPVRVKRGGSWGDFAGDCRSAYRLWAEPSFRDDGLGFRVSLSPSGK